MLSSQDSYDSKMTLSKISKVFIVVSAKYSSLKENMSVDVDRLEEVIEQQIGKGL